MSLLDIVPSYAIHDDKNIQGFFGPYRWLSNFGLCSKGVWFEGIWYPKSEQAYQAAKVRPEFRIHFAAMSAKESKKEWKKYPPLYDDKTWDAVKNDIMANIVFNKFANNADLLTQLLETGNKYLEETNDWNDTFFGADPRLGGLNNLGKILMKVRSFWK